MRGHDDEAKFIRGPALRLPERDLVLDECIGVIGESGITIRISRFDRSETGLAGIVPVIEAVADPEQHQRSKASPDLHLPVQVITPGLALHVTTAKLVDHEVSSPARSRIVGAHDSTRDLIQILHEHAVTDKRPVDPVVWSQPGIIGEVIPPGVKLDTRARRVSWEIDMGLGYTICPGIGVHLW